jgi:hypothetical protein
MVPVAIPPRELVAIVPVTVWFVQVDNCAKMVSARRTPRVLVEAVEVAEVAVTHRVRRRAVLVQEERAEMVLAACGVCPRAVVVVHAK